MAALAARSLASDLLRRDPSKRISIPEALRRPFATAILPRKVGKEDKEASAAAGPLSSSKASPPATQQRPVRPLVQWAYAPALLGRVLGPARFAELEGLAFEARCFAVFDQYDKRGRGALGGGPLLRQVLLKGLPEAFRDPLRNGISPGRAHDLAEALLAATAKPVAEACSAEEETACGAEAQEKAEKAKPKPGAAVQIPREKVCAFVQYCLAQVVFDYFETPLWTTPRPAGEVLAPAAPSRPAGAGVSAARALRQA